MSQSVELELPENLTVAHVQALHEQLEALVDDKTNDSIIAHAKEVRRVDTAGLQLLLVAKAALRIRSKRCVPPVLSWPTAPLNWAKR